LEIVPLKTKNFILLLASHGIVGALGFAGGIYTLPILIAPDAPTEAQVSAVAAAATYTGAFRRDLQDSDALHWGEGPYRWARLRFLTGGNWPPDQTTSFICRLSSSRQSATSIA
jgi:hypothetical protein